MIELDHNPAPVLAAADRAVMAGCRVAAGAGVLGGGADITVGPLFIYRVAFGCEALAAQMERRMTSELTDKPGSRETVSGPAQLAWHTLGVDQVLHSEGVDAQRGLSSAEAAARAQRLARIRSPQATPSLAGTCSSASTRTRCSSCCSPPASAASTRSKQLGTGLLLILLTLFNAVEGLQQEGKAAKAVSALQKMVIIKAKVRRDGQLAEIPAGQLVPGDIVAIDAGDIVPADGRLTKAATLEVDESALTGESLPAAKGTDPVAGPDTALGDRTDMVYMNTNVTRGAGEFVVTATGMATEVGHISGLLAGEQPVKTPLTRQLDRLTRQILVIARPRTGRLDGPEPGPGRDVHRGLQRRRRLRHRRDPGWAAHRGHDDNGLGDDSSWPRPARS